jgi:hypothetical protein
MYLTVSSLKSPQLQKTHELAKSVVPTNDASNYLIYSDGTIDSIVLFPNITF